MRKKIAVQITVFISIFMVIVFVFNLFMLSGNSKLMFTKAKDELTGRDLKQVVNSIGFDTLNPWLLEYAEQHLEETKEGYVWDDEDFDRVYGGLINRYEDGDVNLYDFNEFSSAEKRTATRLYYKILDGNINYDTNALEFDYMAIIDIRENSLKVICDGTKDDPEDDRFIEEVIIAETEKNGTLETYRKNESTEPVFGLATDKNGISWYVGYYSLAEGGAVNYAVCCIKNSEDFNKTLSKQRGLMIGLAVAGLIVFLFLLVWFLYFETVKPVTQIQKSVRSYTNDKDTERVIDELGKIRVSNEFGMLSKDISELAEEMDRYTKENILLATENQRIATELELAAKIQMNALPEVDDDINGHPEFKLAASMNPAKEVGGDFYDFFMLDDTHLALVIADVSGKGVPAALFMMMAKIQIENYAKIGLSPKDVLNKTNEALCLNNKENMFVTVWFGILDISTGIIKAVNAGHEYPILRQPGSDYELYKDKHGVAAGSMEGISYKEYEIALQKGSTLFLYTDGVAEASNSNEELFGTKRMLEAMNNVGDCSTDVLLDAVRSATDSFVGDAPQFDDLTMLAVKLI